MKVTKIITNMLLMPSVLLWLVCGISLPLLHSVSMFMVDVSNIEFMVLNTMVYASLVATPVGLFNYLTDVNYKSIIKKIKEGGSKEEKGGCSSCKKK